MTGRRFSRLALRVAFAPIVATAPGTALIVYAYGTPWPGGVIIGCLLVATLPMLVMWKAVDVMIVVPLRTIIRAIYRLTEGDFSARTAATDGTELDAIMRALDDLAGRLETALGAARASERRYRLLFEHNPAGMFRTRESDGRVLDCNPAAVRMLGYGSVLEAKTHRAEDFYANPEDRKALIASLHTNDGITSLEVQVRCKDGREFPVLLSVCRIHDAGETFLEGQFIDISGREQPPVPAGATNPLSLLAARGTGR